MFGSGNTTVPSATDDPVPARREARSVYGLVYVWNKREPRRVGEVGLLDPQIGLSWVYGRDAGAPVGSGATRIRFGAKSPGAFADGGPVVGENVSREQLALRIVGLLLEVELVGSEETFVNGVALQRGKPVPLQAGDLVQIRQHAALLVVLRPLAIPALPGDGREDGRAHSFGEADADGIVGESDAAWTLRRELVHAERGGGSVLLLGPSGSRKERAALALHRLARREPFVAVNSAALPEGILEAELFGNLKNYPNAGTPERTGHIGAAEGGTLFLDEIARLSADAQAALLRFLQERRYTRLGDSSPRSADVYVIAATNEDPATLRFDVFMRFDNVIRLPKLAARREDIVLIARDHVLSLARSLPRLAERFVVEVDGRREVDWTPGLVHAMVRAPWPGNVRQLQSFLRTTMAEQGERPLHPPADMTRWDGTSTRSVAWSTPDGTSTRSVDVEVDAEKEAARVARAQVLGVLEQCRWNVTRAAPLLGLPNRHALSRMMEKLGISRE